MELDEDILLGEPVVTASDVPTNPAAMTDPCPVTRLLAQATLNAVTVASTLTGSPTAGPAIARVAMIEPAQAGTSAPTAVAGPSMVGAAAARAAVARPSTAVPAIVVPAVEGRGQLNRTQRKNRRARQRRIERRQAEQLLTERPTNPPNLQGAAVVPTAPATAAQANPVAPTGRGAVAAPPNGGGNRLARDRRSGAAGRYRPVPRSIFCHAWECFLEADRKLKEGMELLRYYRFDG